MHMGTDDCTEDGRSFMASLNPATVNSLNGPYINMKGCHVGQDGDLQGLRNGQRGGLLCLCTPSTTDARGSAPVLSDSWADGWVTVAVAAH